MSCGARNASGRPARPERAGIPRPATRHCPDTASGHGPCPCGQRGHERRRRGAGEFSTGYPRPASGKARGLRRSMPRPACTPSFRHGLAGTEHGLRGNRFVESAKRQTLCIPERVAFQLNLSEPERREVTAGKRIFVPYADPVTCGACFTGALAPGGGVLLASMENMDPVIDPRKEEITLDSPNMPSAVVKPLAEQTGGSRSARNALLPHPPAGGAAGWRAFRHPAETYSAAIANPDSAAISRSIIARAAIEPVSWIVSTVGRSSQFSCCLLKTSQSW